MHALGIFTGFVAVATVATCGYAMFRWAGAWRIAAGIPILTTVAPVALTLSTLDYDPALQNVWPLKLILWCIFSLLLLGALRLAKGIWEGKPMTRVEVENKG
jgi:hypothetical protein